MGGAGEALLGNANQQEQFQRQGPGVALQNQLAQQKLTQEGPQAALGGQTPTNYEMLTKREQVPKFGVNPLTGETYNVHTGQTSGGVKVDPNSAASIDRAATYYHTTGQLPQGISRNRMMVKQIMDREASLFPDNTQGGLAGAKAGYQADSGSLGKLQAQADSVNAFERTALSNLDQFLTHAKGIVDTGSPLFNAPARKFMQSVAGDPKMTAFNVSRQVAVQEVSKVLSGAMGQAAVSDSARHEVEGLIGPDASLAQIEKAAQILHQDMANRRAAYAAQTGEIRGRIGGQPVPAAQSGAPAPQAERKTVGGKTYEKRPDGWYEVPSG